MHRRSSPVSELAESDDDAHTRFLQGIVVFACLRLLARAGVIIATIVARTPTTRGKLLCYRRFDLSLRSMPITSR